MRYQCRLPDKPARNDVLYPGTYNARRDSLEGYWRGAFGRHGVVVQAFYEHVPRHAIAGRSLGADEKEQDVVLEFRPDPPATCWPASGRNGKDRKAACFRLPRSPTHRPATSPLPGMTAAWCRSAGNTWTPGSTPNRMIWRASTASDDREEIRYVYEEAG